jgi:hypothetical protein
MEDILERGFQLAYFIFPSRPHAVLILSDAVNKLKAQYGRESRRSYWRDKYLKRGITRITREEGDMLQWLIFYESDRFEKEQEAARQAKLKDMVLRYIKSLVRMTSAMSSFHVNIGLQRLLHNYSTVETQQVYESITDRYSGADEYRRAKSVLMNKLEERFDGMLKTSKTQHGEIRFESADQQEQWAGLVDLCLKEFTPWSTCNTCPVPSNFDGLDKLPLPLAGKGASEGDQNQIEIDRCHVFIDPLCFGRLVRALSIEPPSHRLDVPRFFMENSDNSSYSDLPPQPPKLSAEERKTITDFAAIQAERRQKAAPTTLSVVIDGKECARLDASGTTSRQLEIREGAELIEIWTEDAGEPLLLATHQIDYAGTQGVAPASFRLRFRNGAELVLQISGSNEAPEGLRTALVTLSYRPSAQRVDGLARWLSPAPRFALMATILVALGWFLGTNAHRQTAGVMPTPSGFAEEDKASLMPKPAPIPAKTMQASELPVTYRLVPDELATRGGAGSGTPSVIVPPHAALVQLELPIYHTAAAAKSFRCTLKTFLKDEPILAASCLTAKRNASGITIVTFSLPSTFLEANSDYLVDLRSNGKHGDWEELSTYSFHTVKSLK